jgi:hypothetical protein
MAVPAPVTLAYFGPRIGGTAEYDWNASTACQERSSIVVIVSHTLADGTGERAQAQEQAKAPARPLFALFGRRRIMCRPGDLSASRPALRATTTARSQQASWLFEG